MTLAGVNVLIHAFRPDASKHAMCRAWLDALIDGGAPFGVSTLALSALVRIFDPPSETAGALGFSGGLLGQPHAIRVELGHRHWSISRPFARTAVASGAAGDRRLVCGPRHRARLRLDHARRDFARFKGLKWHRRGRQPTATPYLCPNFAFRLSANAAIPSFWSSVANMAWKTRRSKRMPSASVVS